MELLKSNKFWYTVLACVVFTVVAVTKTVEFTSVEVMTFVLAVLGANLTAHTVSDIAAMRTGLTKPRVVMEPTEPKDTPASRATVEPTEPK